ncbi:FecR family protein [Dyadobacter tibetensis]|uniref:FecR family protein n=1 Tax=Dyadobacter tibetensis TaxID=1211851 RepID=UPI000471D375|nr:FecR domain-containing protein [Dyadobacter tibetensis]
MKSSISKNTFFEYLAGRANPLERKRVEEWIQQADHAERYYQWILEWEIQNPQFVPDSSKAFSLLQSKLEDDKPREELFIDTPRARRLYWPRIGSQTWQIAAAVLVMFGVGYWFRKDIYYKSYCTNFGQTTTVYLEDGSRVALNANSKLQVPRLGFLGGVRRVHLHGEAEFSISHTSDNKRFVVETSDTFQVEVLGTQFSVLARPRATEVALKSGSVCIDYTEKDSRRQMLMKPGQVATLEEGGGVRLQQQQFPEAFAAWKEQRYVFNGTSILEVTQVVEDNFGVVITASPEILSRKITGNFKTQDVEELLKTISEVLNLKIEPINQDTILITHF